ncbi:MAG: NADH-quinone oxidoreductase subunit NuoF [Chloroflexi bacterium]|nr:NADH-quinone oxidoreductase subunit NuoF [Chloroflexota bacterium]MBM4450377.1 NADH-quinone oxidoreductase subunit NuoF [Chloroflexota bacterium]
MDFAKLRNKAIKEWQALWSGDKPLILIGLATCGIAAGASAVLKTIDEELARRNIKASIIPVGCIGLCYLEPLVDIVKPGYPRICYSQVTPERAIKLIEDYLVNDNPHPDLALGSFGESTVENIPKFFEHPMLKPQVRIATRNCGHINPEDINHYIAKGGYNGLNMALGMYPEDVIKEVEKSGLRGRGGAGFPTWRKWDEARNSKTTPKFVVCNADEGDPGAFMDRSVLEGDPHSVLEGMAIAGHAIGTSNGYIYVRAEYPLAVRRLQIAIDQAKKLGLLGDNILDTEFSFNIDIMQGAGAFVCGEGSALMYSIEGKRGMPRVRPPRSVASGLWGLPTSLNNVETFANVSPIVTNGGDWYASYGTETSKGTKTFALTGKIGRPGLIEVPMGITLRQIIYEIGGGIPGDKPFKAIQTGGPSGGCLPESLLDTPVDFETLTKAGSIMGSGGMVVLDEDTCIVDVARYFIAFCRDESCGKCVPCREGLPLMSNMLERITQGDGNAEDIEQLIDIGETIINGSLCGLGNSAPNPVLSSIRYFRDEWESHVIDKRCPALVCKALINFYILPDKCAGCGICARACPVEAISGGKRLVHVINQKKCIKCTTCLEKCPERFSAIVKVTGEQIEVPKEPVPVGANK